MREGENRKDYEDPRNTSALGASIEKASRERTWDESAIEERIQRLRRATQETSAWLEMVSGQLRHVPPHQHGEGGRILVEQDRGIGAAGQAGSRFDPLA